MPLAHSTLTLGARRTLRGAEALEHRLRVLLQTRPGQIPWRPGFGLEAQDFVGHPASAETLSDLDWRIREAIARWLPDVEVIRSDVVALTESRPPAYDARRPVEQRAEANLLSVGSVAEVRVRLTVRTPDGELDLDLPAPV